MGIAVTAIVSWAVAHSSLVYTIASPGVSLVNLFIASNAFSWFITYGVLIVFIGIIAYQTQMLKNMAEQLRHQPHLMASYATSARWCCTSRSSTSSWRSCESLAIGGNCEVHEGAKARREV